MSDYRSRTLFSLVVCSVGSLVSACGGDKTPAFLPLQDVCSSFATDVCDARENCCGGKVDTGCESAVQASCEAERSRFVKDSSLSYDGVHAESVQEELRSALLQCESPFLVGRFFEGTRAAGKACQRDTQCESLSCDAKLKTCTKVEAPALCNSADK